MMIMECMRKIENARINKSRNFVCVCVQKKKNYVNNWMTNEKYRRNHSLYVVESKMIEFSTVRQNRPTLFSFWKTQKLWNLFPQNSNMCSLCPIRGWALIPSWCVIKGEECSLWCKDWDKPIDSTVNTLKHSNTHQLTHSLTHTYKELSSCFSDEGGQMHVVSLITPSYDKHNTRTSRPWLQGALRIQNHSVVYLPSGQKLLHNPCEKFANKLRIQKILFWKIPQVLLIFKTMFNVPITKRTHVFIGFGI